MTDKIRSIGLVAKPGNEEAISLARDLAAWLLDRGLVPALDETLTGLKDLAGSFELTDYAAQDLIVVLGGDGTMLHAARQAGLSGVPLVGINLGSLGFLTAVTVAQTFPALEMILRGELRPEERMRLRVKVERRGRLVFESVVLNDVVLTKEALARIVDLATSIDGRRLTDYRADGLIVSTPTGSTAYNLSAGGPILHPLLSAMIVTPICPFTLANRPLVVPGTAELKVGLGPGAEGVYLTCDGQEGLSLAAEDQVIVSRTKTLKLFPSPTADHYSILRTKLGWGNHGTNPAS